MKSANNTAQQLALQSMENIVMKQSTQLNFSDTYLVIGLIFNRIANVIACI